MAKKAPDIDDPLPRLDPVHDRPEHPLDPDTIKKGDYLCIRIFGQVTEVNPKDQSVVVKNARNGNEFVIEGRDMFDDTESADYVKEVVPVSRTQMARILATSFGTIYSVAFVKKDKQERVLRGDLLKEEEVFGRSLCRDLEVLVAKQELLARIAQDPTLRQKLTKDEEELLKDDGLRLADHRTLVSLIVRGVKYRLN